MSLDELLKPTKWKIILIAVIIFLLIVFPLVYFQLTVFNEYAYIGLEADQSAIDAKCANYFPGAGDGAQCQTIESTFVTYGKSSCQCITFIGRCSIDKKTCLKID